MVSNVVAIDKPAGPSEIIIIADNTANAKLIALDLISQAEHGVGGVLGLVTTSPHLADKVENEIEQLHVDIPLREIVVDVLSEGGFIYIVQNIDDAVDFTNQFSPEHLEIHARNPREIANKISTAGLIQIGPYTPVSSTDYCIGVNHVLPTNGYGKISSGVTVLDFLRFLSIVEATKSGLDTIRKHVRNLAEAEGLPNHILAVEGRFKYETD